jgi:hypothetical protein
MRVLAKVAIDTPTGNAAIKSGALGKVIESTIALVKPEAAYFTTDAGKRCAYFVFDLKDVSDIPMIAEPWFHELGASVDISPLMVAEDVGKGLQKAFSR